MISRMTGALISSLEDEDNGLPFCVGTRFILNESTHKSDYSPVVAFDVSDERIINAIRERDEDIFKIFDQVLKNGHRVLEIDTTLHGMELGWEHHLDGSPKRLAKYKQSLIALLSRL